MCLFKYMYERIKKTILNRDWDKGTEYCCLYQIITTDRLIINFNYNHNHVSLAISLKQFESTLLCEWSFNFQVPWVPYDEFVVLAAESTESLKRLFLFMTNYVVNNGHKQMNPNRVNLTNCTYMSKCVNWKNYYLNKITSILMTFEVYWETIGRSNSFDKYLFCSKWTIWRLNC